MKNNNVLVYFVAALTLIIVFVVTTAQRDFWNQEITDRTTDYYHVTLIEACRKYDGSPDWENYTTTDREDREIKRPMFVCRFY